MDCHSRQASTGDRSRRAFEPVVTDKPASPVGERPRDWLRLDGQAPPPLAGPPGWWSKAVPAISSARASAGRAWNAVSAQARPQFRAGLDRAEIWARSVRDAGGVFLGRRPWRNLALPLGVARRRWLRVAAIVGLVVILPALVFLAYALATIPRDGGMAAEPSLGAVNLASSDGQVFATRGVLKGQKLTAGDLPLNLRNAIIAIEDRRFMSHHGLDVRGMGRALVRSFGGGREGASTITQQLARLTYLSQERSLRRKVQEAALAIWLDATLSKDEILARYLNAAYFGGGAYGADAAARRYYGKPAKDLDISEAAMLAGLVRAPSALAPHRNLDGARARAELVLGAMVETGAITKEQAEAARQNPATIWDSPTMPPGTGYFVDLAEAESRKAAGVADADLDVSTTLDLRLQAVAERVIEKALGEEGRARNVTQAALVALAPDGAILAMVGGRSYADSQFNRAVQAKRQAGSLFKLFVYLAAMRAGADPQNVAVDAPTQVGEWEPENYGGRYRGRMTLRSAFANSINTVAVQVAEAVGIERVIETARSLGVTSELPKVPSLALGSAEVTLIEMVRAYGAVASGSAPITPYLVKTVTRAGEPLHAHAQAPMQSMDPQVREQMVDMLTAVVREGTGKNARLQNVVVGGKTGTTQESRDAWFVGFTQDFTIGVWVGNDDNTPTKSVTGGDLPARIWRSVATEAVRLRTPRVAAVQPRETARAPREAPREASQAPVRPAAALRGYPSVVDTSTLVIEGQEIRLAGILGVGGREAREFARHVRRRPIACEPDGAAAAYRCILDGQDLARLILFNGGARIGPDASPELKEVEEQAREAQVGIWRR